MFKVARGSTVTIGRIKAREKEKEIEGFLPSL
jgi:hypothetical protein